MKKFLLRLLLFALPPLLLLGGWCAFVLVLDWRSYRASLVAPADAHILVCGDSQTANGLDPAHFPGLFNFSAAATLPDQNLLRLKDVLEANPGQFKLALLDVTPILFEFAWRPLSEEDFARVHFTLHLYHWADAKRPIGNSTALVRDVLLVRKFNEFRKCLLRGCRWRSSLVGGYVAKLEQGFLNPKFNAKALKTADGKITAFNQIGGFDLSSEVLGVIREKVALFRACSVEPVLITTPLSRFVLENVERRKIDDFRACLRDFSEEVSVRWMDCLDMPFEDGDWHDANHLNAFGAAKFTMRVRENLECAK